MVAAQNIKIELADDARRAMRDLTKAIERQNALKEQELRESRPPLNTDVVDKPTAFMSYMSCKKEHTTHSEDTLMKVAEAIRSNGIPVGQIPEIISSMQNAGILFREREVSDGGQSDTGGVPE